MKKIIREYEIYEDTITLCLEDPRDNYVFKDSLGKIGTINISSFGVFITENIDEDPKIEQSRKELLEEEFKSIFKETEYNPISEKYYQKILLMIKNGELSKLGYFIKDISDEYLDDDMLIHLNKKHK